MVPAVLSIKAGRHKSFTETAVNPDNVIPAAKGCFKDVRIGIYGELQ